MDHMSFRRVVVSQRVDVVEGYNERRDALDQRWASFLLLCGIVPFPSPNNPEAAAALLEELKPDGVLLTGGNDLEAYGGDAPERDETERRLIEYARSGGRPLLGVCRGMQLIMSVFGAALEPIDGHVATLHKISLKGDEITVNSYHRHGAKTVPPEFNAIAIAEDGVVEGVVHEKEPIVGIMWHPERVDGFERRDVDFFRSFFAQGK